MAYKVNEVVDIKRISGYVFILLAFYIIFMGVSNLFNPIKAVSEKEIEKIEDIDTKRQLEEIEFNENNSGGLIIDKYQRDISNYRVENLENILDYLDPTEMNNYNDLLTLYASYLKDCLSDNPIEYFDKNYKVIGNILGIYDKNEFINFNKNTLENGINNKSKVNYIRLNKLDPVRSLLKASVTIFYDSGEVTIEHYINYVYIGKQAHLFLYSRATLEDLSVIKKTDPIKEVSDNGLNGVNKSNSTLLSDIDLDYVNLRMAEKENEGYYNYKDINYYLMKYFDSINKNDLDLDLINKDYISFFGHDKDSLTKDFKNFSLLDYDIKSLSQVGNTIIADVNYRQVSSDLLYQKTFAINGNNISDQGFIKTKLLNNSIVSKDYSIEIGSKAIFDKYEAYKIEIENLSDGNLVIDESMYGFSARKTNNIYYHLLLSKKLPYELVPGEKRTFLIKFNCLNPDLISVTLNKKQIDIILHK